MYMNGNTQTSKWYPRRRASAGRLCYLTMLLIMLAALGWTGPGKASQDNLPFLPGISWASTEDEMRNALQRENTKTQTETEESVSFGELESRELNRYFHFSISKETAYDAFRMAVYEIDLTQTITIRPSKSAVQTVTEVKSLLKNFYGNQLETFSADLKDLSSFETILAVTSGRDSSMFLSGALNGARTMISNIYGDAFIQTITDYSCWITPDSTIVLSVYSDMPGSDQNLYLFLARPGSMFENDETAMIPSIIPGIHFQEDYLTVLDKIDSVAQIVETEENVYIYAVVDGEYCIGGLPTDTYLFIGSDMKLAQIFQLIPMADSSFSEKLMNELQDKYGQYEKLTEPYVETIRSQLGFPIDEVYAWIVDHTILYLAPAKADSICYVIQNPMN